MDESNQTYVLQIKMRPEASDEEIHIRLHDGRRDMVDKLMEVLKNERWYGIRLTETRPHSLEEELAIIWKEETWPIWTLRADVNAQSGKYVEVITESPVEVQDLWAPYQGGIRVAFSQELARAKAKITRKAARFGTRIIRGR